MALRVHGFDTEPASGPRVSGHPQWFWGLASSQPLYLQVMYGGRAIDSFDRRILTIYMDEYLGDFIFDTFQPFHFFRNKEVDYKIPHGAAKEEFVGEISQMPESIRNAFPRGGHSVWWFCFPCLVWWLFRPRLGGSVAGAVVTWEGVRGARPGLRADGPTSAFLPWNGGRYIRFCVKGRAAPGNLPAPFS